MDSIVFYNVDKYGMELKKAKAPTPVIWDHMGAFPIMRYMSHRTFDEIH